MGDRVAGTERRRRLAQGVEAADHAEVAVPVGRVGDGDAVRP
ncbi:hypothetical protein RB614_39560 [Phytohabitans sp. ZYX-F-186]|uniref:Uncharacterized protein n=1 Tax=Phytohabitans maris TaxID=3071409 RepID=A0ABU0ZV04_9ACTN|nr:hypothetical protein [Phytohabitans sp. ZYX-F-186]MDQ7910611.1 hypothetical protein [Phytohabitans sp. ZYX-F-186]